MGRIFGYFRARTRTHADAEDLTAETFVKALRGLPRYRESQGRFAAWLFTIAHHLLVDHLRRRRETVALDDEDIARKEMERDPGQWAVEAERLGQMATALRDLPEETREIVALRIGGRLSYAEIGTLVGLNGEAAKARFHRAMKSLRTRLEAEGYE